MGRALVRLGHFPTVVLDGAAEKLRQVGVHLAEEGHKIGVLAIPLRQAEQDLPRGLIEVAEILMPAGDQLLDLLSRWVLANVSTRLR